MENAVIAQSVERVIGNDEVGSSNLPNSSKKKNTAFAVFFFFFCAVADLNCRPKFNLQRMLAAKPRTSGSSNLPNRCQQQCLRCRVKLPTQIQSSFPIQKNIVMVGVRRMSAFADIVILITEDQIVHIGEIIFHRLTSKRDFAFFHNAKKTHR